MDWLKSLLKKHGVSEELITAITEDTKDQNYIPQHRFDEVNNTLKEVKTQLAERDTQLKDLGDKVKGNEDLEKKINDLVEQNKKAADEYDAKLKEVKIDTAIKLKLKESKAKYEDLLLGKFDKAKLVVEGEEIKGLDEQLESIKENYAELFSTTSTPPVKGKKPNSGSPTPTTNNPWSKEHFNLTEQGRLLRENPELAAKFMASK